MKKIDEWFRLNESRCHGIRTPDIPSTLLYLGEPVDPQKRINYRLQLNPPAQSLCISDPPVELLRITALSMLQQTCTSGTRATLSYPGLHQEECCHTCYREYTGSPGPPKAVVKTFSACLTGVCFFPLFSCSNFQVLIVYFLKVKNQKQTKMLAFKKYYNIFCIFLFYFFLSYFPFLILYTTLFLTFYVVVSFLS